MENRIFKNIRFAILSKQLFLEDQVWISMLLPSSYPLLEASITRVDKNP